MGVLWGIPYLFMKVAVVEISTPVIVLSRVVIGGLLLIPFAIYQGNFKDALINWKFILVYAIGEFVLPWYLITNAQIKMSTGLAGLLVATVSIWATIFAAINGDKTALHHKRLFGLLIGILGIFFIVGIESFQQKNSPFAIVQILIASMSYAWAVNMISSKLPHVAGIAINGLAMAMTGLIYLPFALFNLPVDAPSTKAIVSTISLGLFCTAFAFILYFIVLAEIGPARASLVVYINTAIAVLLGIVILREKITLGIVVGLPMVLIGSYLASRMPVIKQAR